jgi:hypothetical protein
MALGTPTPAIFTVDGAVTTADGKWHHCIASRGGGSLVMRIDNVNVSSTSVGATLSVNQTASQRVCPTWSVNAYWDSMTIYTGFSGYQVVRFEEMAGCPNTINWLDSPQAILPGRMVAPQLGGPWPFYFDEQSGGLQTQGMQL